MSTGWIKLNRDYQEDELWREKRVFSKFEAWLDIRTQVQYLDKEIKHLIGMKIITTAQGQSIKSLDTWAVRWKWTKSKVRRFLKRLEKDGKIRFENVVKTVRITVRNASETESERTCNASETESERTTLMESQAYAMKRNANETQMKRKRNANETQMKPDKKVKKERREEETTPLTPQGGFDQEKSNPDILPPEKPKTRKLATSAPYNSYLNLDPIPEKPVKPKPVKFDPGKLCPVNVNPETWAAFIEVRTMARAKNTERAISMIVNKLAGFEKQGMNPETVVAESVMNSWKSVFPLKNNFPGSGRNKFNTGVTNGGMSEEGEELVRRCIKAGRRMGIHMPDIDPDSDVEPVQTPDFKPIFSDINLIK